jgi:hypothetical protein
VRLWNSNYLIIHLIKKKVFIYPSADMENLKH